MSSVPIKPDRSLILRWFTLIFTAGFTCAVFLIAVKSRPSVLGYTKTFKFDRAGLFGDSWRPMVSASQYLRNHPKTHHVYDAMFRDSMKFQYPLSSLLIYDIPHKITGASYYQVNYGLDLLYFIGVLLFGPLCARILLELLKQPRFETMNFNSQRNKFLLYVLMFALTFVYYPILRSYALGQIQTLLTVLAALVLWAWLTDKRVLAGILIWFFGELYAVSGVW